MKIRDDKLERIPLECVEDISSEESLKSREREIETHFHTARPQHAPKEVHNRSYSMDIGMEDIKQTIRRLPSHNMMISGMKTQSSHDVRRRQSSLGASYLSSRRPSNHAQPMDHHVEKLFSVIEDDDTLMDDNPLSEQMRIETLRKMPTSLTLKRSLKHRLGTSVSSKPKRLPLSFWKTIKYFLSMYLSKFRMGIKDVFYVMELWYKSIKTIEGHFGTSTATYFRFLRWLFLINSFVFIISFGFLVIPQLLMHLYEPQMNQPKNVSSQDQIMEEMLYEQGMQKTSEELHPYDLNGVFSIGNLFTGEGWLENTELYYGFYSNHSLSLISNYKYSIPASYIFTLLFCYVFAFVIVATSAAKSYRKSYIETGGGVKHVYSHKLFCGWDFGIATEQGAHLKRQSLFNEFKELLNEESEKLEKERNPKSFLASLTTLSLQMFVNFLVIVILCSTGLLIWSLLLIHKTWDIAEDNNNIVTQGKPHPPTITVSLCITLILLLVPMFFSYMTRFEGYQSPRTALYVTLWRTFGLEVVVLSVLLAFWLHSPDSQCWETSLGQEIYRLVIMDFLITTCGTSAAELIRSRIYLSWDKIGMPEFDIARNTLILIYNQTLFWIGFFFSPLLPCIIVLKMLITFYIKRMGVMYHCQPSSRAWRAAQTETIFLVLSFLSLFGVLFALGFVFTRVPASDCGPFRGHKYMYQMILIDIFTISEESTVWNILSYSMRPGVVGCVLVSMCVGIYYVRAVAKARVKMVKILQEMLVLEAKDKEYLLANIFNITENQMASNCNGSSSGDYLAENSNTWEFHNVRSGAENVKVNEEVTGDVTHMTIVNDSEMEDENLWSEADFGQNDNYKIMNRRKGHR